MTNLDHQEGDCPRRPSGHGGSSTSSTMSRARGAIDGQGAMRVDCLTSLWPQLLTERPFSSVTPDSTRPSRENTMPKPFVPLTLLQFRDMLVRFPFSEPSMWFTCTTPGDRTARSTRGTRHRGDARVPHARARLQRHRAAHHDRPGRHDLDGPELEHAAGQRHRVTTATAGRDRSCSR